MNETIKIVEATEEDVISIQNCVRQSYQHYVERLGKEPGPMIDDYAYRVNNDNVYVVRAEDTVIGLVVLVLDGSRCLLDNIAVAPEASGKGLGKVLMRFAEEQTQKFGFSELELYTHELMAENISMYEKWGYKVDRLISEKGFNRVYMKKNLGNREVG